MKSRKSIFKVTLLLAGILSCRLTSATPPEEHLKALNISLGKPIVPVSNYLAAVTLATLFFYPGRGPKVRWTVSEGQNW